MAGRWGAGIAVVAAVVAFFDLTVCEEQLADDGTVVEVCRRLEATDPPVIAFGIVLLVAVGAFFTEVQGAAAASAKETSLNADRVADLARKIAEDASAASMAERPDAGARRATAPSDLDQAVGELAAEYNATRTTQPSGNERTSVMTTTVSKLTSLLSGVDESQFDLAAHLRNGDRGRRVAAYAYLYANPLPVRTPELVGALVEEDKPFGQYWALRALHRQLQSDPAALDGNTRRRLEELRPRLGPGTDRARGLDSILATSSA